MLLVLPVLISTNTIIADFVWTGFCLCLQNPEGDFVSICKFGPIKAKGILSLEDFVQILSKYTNASLNVLLSRCDFSIRFPIHLVHTIMFFLSKVSGYIIKHGIFNIYQTDTFKLNSLQFLILAQVTCWTQQRVPFKTDCLAWREVAREREEASTKQVRSCGQASCREGSRTETPGQET